MIRLVADENKLGGLYSIPPRFFLQRMNSNMDIFCSTRSINKVFDIEEFDNLVVFATTFALFLIHLLFLEQDFFSPSLFSPPC